MRGPGLRRLPGLAAGLVTRDNVLEDAELEAYSAIPEEERLSGQILSKALSTFGDTSTGAQMTDAELEKQVNSLL